MGKIKVTDCDIEGIYVIEPTVFKDERGYFVETYNPVSYTHLDVYKRQSL